MALMIGAMQHTWKYWQDSAPPVKVFEIVALAVFLVLTVGALTIKDTIAGT